MSLSWAQILFIPMNINSIALLIQSFHPPPPSPWTPNQSLNIDMESVISNWATLPMLWKAMNLKE